MSVTYHCNTMFRLVKQVRFKTPFRPEIKTLQILSLNFSYIHHIGKQPLRPTTLGALVEISCKRHPDTLAIISRAQKQSITYGEILKQADKLAAGLLALGIQKGDRLGLWTPNIIQWAVCKFATARAGIILVPLNPTYQASEMKYSINKIGIKALVCMDSIKHIDYYDILNEISGDLKTGEPNKLNCKEIPSLKTVITISDKVLRGTYNYNEVLDLADEKSVRSIQGNQHMVQPDDVCSIQFSSGTTGQPKAVVLSHFQVANNGYYLARGWEIIEKQHIACVQVPLFHTYGERVSESILHSETTLVIPSVFYNSVENLEALYQERCSYIFGTPTMYTDLVAIQERRKLKIAPKFALISGSSCAPSLVKKVQDVLGVKIIKIAYGLSETTAAAFLSVPNEDQNRVFTTVGCISDHMEAKVVDANNKIVPFGSPGELCLRGYSNMLCYWDDYTKTKETMGDDRWLYTGDQFILEEDGYGKIVGRLKEMIIRGGENVFPKEIEDCLNNHPDILESHVVGLPHERLGEEVCACVRVTKHSKLTLELLTEFCKGKLAKYKIPTVLKIMDSFPKTQSGKVQKFVLQKTCAR